MADDWKNDPTTFSKMLDELINAEHIKQQKIMYDSILGLGYQNIYTNYQQPKIIQILHKTEDLIIEYHEKDNKYICKYIPLDITITIPADMLATKLGIHATYYGIGQSEQYTLAQVCSRIVFAIKNFGPTLNAIHDRIEENKFREVGPKLDIPWTIRYIREETNMIEGPDWEIMERS